MGQTVQKYRVDTDKGSYEVEVEVPPQGMNVLAEGRKSLAMNDVPEGQTPASSPFGEGLMGLLNNAAGPKSMGDFLSLIIPSEIGEAGPSVMRMIKSGINEARTGGRGVMTTAGNLVKGAKNYAFPSSPAARFTGPGGFSTVSTAAKPRPGYFGPQAAEGADIVGQAGVNELPTYLQQQLMEQAGSQASEASGASRVGMPPAREPTPTQAAPAAPDVPRQMPPLTVKGAGGRMPELTPSAPPAPEVPRQMPPLVSGSRGGSMPPLVPSAAKAGRLVGKAPTLEESLLQAIEEAGAADKPRMSTGAPDITSTAGGPISQSGKFPKSEQVGQAGGYSSGRPATGPDETTLEELLGAEPTSAPTSRAMKDVTERRVNPNQGAPAGMSDRRHAELLQKLGGKQEVTPEIAAEMRRMHGARDAAKLLGITEDEVRRLAPGPSRTPLVAEERIRNAANKARGDE